jgi:hypothetical protein
MASPDPRPRAHESTPGSRWRLPRSLVVHDTLVLLALWGLAVAQPVLDLFGRNPEFFVVNDISRGEIVGFGLFAALLAPVALVVLDLALHLIGPKVGQVGHAVLVGLLGAAFLLSLLVQVTDDALIAVALALFGGALLANLEATSRPVRTGLRYLAFGPVLFLVAFFGFSATGDLLRPSDALDVEPGVVGSPAPVVVLSMDEFPVASLLRPNGTIDAERFPNFARLADQSSWYPNATSVSSNTIESVPAMLTGVVPEAGLLPNDQDHPRSLFTLLGDGYAQHVDEQVTELCPSSVCASDSTGFDLSRLRGAVVDAAAVYANSAAPPSFREHLPRVDQSWGDFLDDANVATGGDGGDPDAAGASTVADGAPAEDLGADPDCPDIDLWCGPARISEMIDSIRATPDPSLWMVHATFPHAPWILGRHGQQYAPRTIEFPGRTANGQWEDEVDVVRQGLQRHLLQVGAMDELVGRLIDRLEDEGLWEDALVVVLSDHGVAFTPGQPLRRPVEGTEHEIYNIPMFIKAPGQTEGEAHEGNALNVDTLPTIVDLLDIEVDWTFDGQSLVGGERHRADKPVVNRGVVSFAPTDFDGVLEVVRRNRSLLPHGDGWAGVYGIGRYGELVGERVTSLDLRSVPAGVSGRVAEADTLAAWDPDSAQLAPILLHGTLEGSTTIPGDALLSLNGTVAAGVVDLHASPDGGLTFTALVDEDLLVEGANDVSLLLPAAAGARVFAEVPLG